MKNAKTMPKQETLNMLKSRLLSQTTKLDGIYSWSLQAGETCPGSIDKNGNPVMACAACYAKLGNYLYPQAKNRRAYNMEIWKTESWVSDMVKALSTERYFRWFDSGDMYSISLAKKMYQIMQQTPWVSHWLPTRMAKFDKFASIIADMQALPNVMVRYSSDSVLGGYDNGIHGSTIIPDESYADENITVCRAYDNADHTCNGCRNCWNKEVPVIGYVLHGKRSKKVFKLALETK